MSYFDMDNVIIVSVQYDSLRNNVTTMKERYEERIEEIETERDNLSEQLDTVQAELKTARAEGTGSTVAAPAVDGNLLDEVSMLEVLCPPSKKRGYIVLLTLVGRLNGFC